MPIQSEISNMEEFNGTIILGDGETYAYKNHILTHSDLPTYVSEDDEVVYPGIYSTPNNKKIVYIVQYYSPNPPAISSWHYFLYEKEGDVKELVDLGKTGELRGWFDNERLLFSINGPKGDIILYNPSTLEKQWIIPTMKDIEEIELPIWSLSGPMVLYNRDLSRGFYFSISKGFTLWDTENECSIWNGPPIYSESIPQWSPDGKYFAISRNTNNDDLYSQELYLLTEKGEEIQLSSFSDMYEETYIGMLQWSPNGEKIALWYQRGHNSQLVAYKPRIAVIDIKGRKIVDYCIEVSRGRIIWSPDNKYIAILGSSEYAEPGNIIIIDIESQNAAILGKSVLSPAAWIAF